MFKRSFFSALTILAASASVFAQGKGPNDRMPGPTFANTAFQGLFKPVVEAAAKSVVRVQVDGKDAALATVVTSDGYLLTKASELKVGKVTIKTRDGRDFDATVTATSDAYDLAVLKTDGSGLTPIKWASTSDAPVGNWIAVPGMASEPVAVGVMSTKPWNPLEQRIPNAQSGFLGIQLDIAAEGAVIDKVTPGGAAEQAGIKPKDVIRLVDTQEIDDSEILIYTLLGYKAGESVKIVLERDGKRMEITAVLGKRPSELIPPQRMGGGGGGGRARGDMQNSWGSKLSDRRTGLPRLFQTDAVIKPADCGAPVVNLDGQAVGLIIARAGRTESHAIPAETAKELVPVLLATRVRSNPSERVDQAREALKKVEAAKASSEILAEARRQVQSALGDEKWWKDQKWWKGHPIERAPAPHLAAAKK
ncbi:MAG TPA: PDZ domain-containing protein [Gemmataceae bacterium]|jgi:serine protease Do|nr:PDZ domain-containing protein [Gemmataceae bacterium]